LTHQHALYRDQLDVEPMIVYSLSSKNAVHRATDAARPSSP
jgi:hypothetical protein